MIDYKINEKLEVLYDLLVDNFTEFEKELIWLIANPEKITNTNKFASLLSGLKMPTFISPLLNKISDAEKADSWLSDFLYTAINLLDDMSTDIAIETPENLVEKLGDWMLENKGELA